MKRTFARRIEREVKISPNKGNSQKEMYTDITPYSDNGMSYQSFQINPVASNYESKIVQLGVQPTADVVQNQGTDQDNQLCKDVAVTGDLNYTKLSPPPNIEGLYPSLDPGKPASENV